MVDMYDICTGADMSVEQCLTCSYCWIDDYGAPRCGAPFGEKDEDEEELPPLVEAMLDGDDSKLNAWLDLIGGRIEEDFWNDCETGEPHFGFRIISPDRDDYYDDLIQMYKDIAYDITISERKGFM